MVHGAWCVVYGVWSVHGHIDQIDIVLALMWHERRAAVSLANGSDARILQYALQLFTVG